MQPNAPSVVIMAAMDIDELYGLPLERFVPERTALARQLRSEGRRDEAAAVAVLRKPSVAAWAVNQLVRTQRQAVDTLFAAGDALRGTQSDVLAGRGDARALRAGGEQVRGALDELTATARGLLSSAGHELSPATLERVAETLRAAALDDDARSLTGQGRLERELRHVGLGGGATSMPARPPARATPKPKPEPKSKPKPGLKPDAARESARAAEREALRHEEARTHARADEREARREVDRTQRAVSAAAQRRERAADALRQADEVLARARAAADAAVDAHCRAEERVEAG
jgi:hypothetical protein